MTARIPLCLLAIAILAAPAARAAPAMLEGARLVPAAAPSNAGQIALHPGSKVSAAGEVWEATGSDLVVRNVTVPTLTPVLPAVGTGTGLAVIVAPGGGFSYLSMNHEGFWVANWLAAHGIAAFVLKYRLNPTPADLAQFAQSRVPSAKSRLRAVNSSPAAAWAQADGLAAIALLRRQSAGFHVDPNRIGFIGFSAGAVTAMNVATAYSAAARPDFVASIYGQMPNRPVPADAPPLFAAAAADDPLLGDAAQPMFTAWRAAGKSAELHIYQGGKHGFGMVAHGTASDHWIDEFFWWLRAEGLLGSKG
jgi:acetyl esterase/lipase